LPEHVGEQWLREGGRNLGEDLAFVRDERGDVEEPQDVSRGSGGGHGDRRTAVTVIARPTA
jgi:hypothetical protein